MSVTKLVGSKRTEYERAKEFILNNPELKDHYNLQEIKAELEELESRHTALVSKKSTLKQSILTYEQYLELFSSLSVKLQESHDMAVIDQVLRKFFSNFTVTGPLENKKQGYVVTHKLKEPWAGFLQSNDVERGRQTMTSNEPILEALHNLLLNYENIKQKLKRLNTLVNDFAYSERAAEMSFLL